jgi:hypothetical protein
MSKEKTYKPGEKAPDSGQYGKVGPKGGKRPEEVTIVKDKPFPPTQKPGEKFKLVDKTKHKK